MSLQSSHTSKCTFHARSPYTAVWAAPERSTGFVVPSCQPPCIRGKSTLWLRHCIEPVDDVTPRTHTVLLGTTKYGAVLLKRGHEMIAKEVYVCRYNKMCNVCWIHRSIVTYEWRSHYNAMQSLYGNPIPIVVSQNFTPHTPRGGSILCTYLQTCASAKNQDPRSTGSHAIARFQDPGSPWIPH